MLRCAKSIHTAHDLHTQNSTNIECERVDWVRNVSLLFTVGIHELAKMRQACAFSLRGMQETYAVYYSHTQNDPTNAILLINWKCSHGVSLLPIYLVAS